MAGEQQEKLSTAATRATATGMSARRIMRIRRWVGMGATGAQKFMLQRRAKKSVHWMECPCVGYLHDCFFLPDAITSNSPTMGVSRILAKKLPQKPRREFMPSNPSNRLRTSMIANISTMGLPYCLTAPPRLGCSSDLSSLLM